MNAVRPLVTARTLPVIGASHDRKSVHLAVSAPTHTDTESEGGQRPPDL